MATLVRNAHLECLMVLLAGHLDSFLRCCYCYFCSSSGHLPSKLGTGKDTPAIEEMRAFNVRN